MARSHHNAMLWLSLYLPQLPIEVFGPTETPLAVFDGPKPRPHICASNPAAAAHGATPGLPLNAALPLCPTLHTRPRDPAAERQALERLAGWAQQFTSLVHLAEGGLLLEVAGSLRLFGGSARLRERLRRELSELGYTVHLAAAPTPLGSWLLATRGIERWVTRRETLARWLARLPVTALELEAETLAQLQGMGLRRVGDCLAQPRPDLIRRVGPAVADYLDRALGQRPDPRRPYRPPDLFRGRVPLPAEVETTEALLFAARRLVVELSGYLQAQGTGVQQARLCLEHRGRPPTEVAIGLVRPSRDPEHLLTLVRERLERLALPAPVDVVRLEADHFPPLEQTQPDLFCSPIDSGTDIAPLLEKLHARLGTEAVTGLHPYPDHRPEAAWRPGIPEGPTPKAQGRPLWLLPTPRRLQATAEGPRLHGPLHLTRGPERIESGWWDGGDVSRDYFVAEDEEGERFWIYRDRRQQVWYLQGIFA